MHRKTDLLTSKSNRNEKEVMSEKTDIRKFLEWLECPGALADSYHSIITRGCHDNADNGNLKLSAHYESSKTE